MKLLSMRRSMNTLSFIIMTSTAILSTPAQADEADDILLCANAYRDLAGIDLDPNATAYESTLFSGRTVAFLGNNVECKLWNSYVNELRDGQNLLIYDGWPVGRSEIYIAVEGALEFKKEELRAEIAKLEELDREAEETLRAASSNAEMISDVLDRARNATSLDIAVDEVQISPLPNGATSPSSNSATSSLDVENIRSIIDSGDFSGAAEKIREIGVENFSPSNIDSLIQSALIAVRPIPSREVAKNLAGYELLSLLDPENTDFLQKLEVYSARLVEAEMPSLRDLSRELSDSRTRLQRDAYWDQVDGKRVRLSGRVTDVRGGGLLDPHIEIQTEISSVTATCYVPDNLNEGNDTLVGLNVGAYVTCSGVLSNYVLFAGLLLSINDAVLE